MNPERWGIVVDDGPKQAEAIAKVITNWGLPSKGFTDPLEALHFAKEHRGSVVFAMFDVRLREKSGADYARIFREQELSHDIVLMTGYQDTIPPEVCTELKKLGVPIYDKPIDLESLLREKLHVWRSVTPGEIAQRSAPEVIHAKGELDDQAVSVVTEATTQNTLSDLSQRLARLEGRLEERDRTEDAKLTRKMTNRQVIAAFVVGALGIIVAIIFGVLSLTRSGSTARPATTSDPLPRIILAENTFPQSATTIVASRKGYFKQHGLEVDVRQFPSGKLALDAVLGGGAHLATVAETPVVFAGFAGLPVVILATISHSDNSCKVAARKDLGVLRPSDLKGKKVATFVGTSAEFFMEAFLKGNGLSLSDVQVITLNPQDMPAALNRGDIAAFFVWEPHIYNASRLLGDRCVVFGGQRFYTETFNIATTKDYAQRNPAVTRAFLEALIDAERFIVNNPTEAIALVSERIGMDPTVLQQIWSDYKIRVLLEPFLVKYMQAEADWAIKSQKVKAGSRIPDFRTLIYPAALRQIKPEAVGIR